MINKIVSGEILDIIDNSKFAEQVDTWLYMAEEKYEYYYELLIKKLNELAEPLYALARSFEARHYRIEVIEKVKTFINVPINKIKDLVHKPKH